MSTNCYWNKLTFLKLGRNALALKSKKIQDIFEETLWHDSLSTDYNDYNVFPSLEHPCIFLLAEEKYENVSLTLIVNYHKIIQKNKLYSSKTIINWLFNDI